MKRFWIAMALALTVPMICEAQPVQDDPEYDKWFKVPMPETTRFQNPFNLKIHDAKNTATGKIKNFKIGAQIMYGQSPPGQFHRFEFDVFQLTLQPSVGTPQDPNPPPTPIYTPYVNGAPDQITVNLENWIQTGNALYDNPRRLKIQFKESWYTDSTLPPIATATYAWYLKLTRYNDNGVWKYKLEEDEPGDQ